MALSTAKRVANLNALSVLFGMNARGSQPLWPRLCAVKKSTGKKEPYGIPGAAAGLREWLGDRLFNKMAAADFEIENKPWEWSHEIDREDYEDDRFGLYDDIFAQAGIEAAHHPDELLFTLLQAGDARVMWDGQYLIDTDHEWGLSGAQSNAETYNMAGSAPTTAEWKAAYHQVRRKMLTYKNDKGKLLNRPRIGPEPNFIALVPPEQEEVAAEAIKAEFLSNNSNIMLDKPDLVGTGYLTTATDFYVACINGPVKPFIFQARQPLKPLQYKGIDDREDKEIKAFTDARYNIGDYGWWTICRLRFT